MCAVHVFVLYAVFLPIPPIHAALTLPLLNKHFHLTITHTLTNHLLSLTQVTVPYGLTISHCDLTLPLVTNPRLDTSSHHTFGCALPRYSSHTLCQLILARVPGHSVARAVICAKRPCLGLPCKASYPRLLVTDHVLSVCTCAAEDIV